MVEQGSKTAPDLAKDRFLESLPSRADELEPWVRAYRADAEALPALSALRRGLHALSAGARRFELPVLAAMLQRLTVRVEATALGDTIWTAADDHALSELIVRLRDPTPLTNAASGVHVSRALVPSEAGPSPRRSSRPPPSAAGDATVMSVRVLLVCSRPHAAELRELLDDSLLQLLHAADPEQALALLHTAAPACAFVAAEFATLPDIDLVRRLQTDPLSRLDGVYLLLPAGASYDAEFLRQTGADGVLIEPLSSGALSPVIERATRRRGRGGLRALSAEREGTVDEIASYVAEEIRTGIAEALRAGPDERIQISDTDALAEVAASAIGRVRSHLAVQSRGRVRFEHAEPEPQPAAADGGEAISLLGTRVLVVDDDAAVRWFFVGLLREAGAEVVQAQDGRDALELARRRHPHVVLSDILMPRVDGFALCRELRRDALLQHVPVILLSWKEDLLERMRELDAGASGYLRKEARGGEVVRAVAATLTARRALCAQLKEDGEVSGRIEDMGVLALLESVATERPDARIRVNDAWNMFEVELRAGQRIALTRTAADGSFARGERALAQLIGVSSGRFSVWPSETSLRGALTEPFAPALERAGKTLAAALDAVSDSNLMHVARLAFDESEIDQLLRLTPTRLHEVVARFRSGDTSAQQLLLRGSFTPAELEGHLRELARRGAITGAWNARGEDLMATAWREREDEPGRLLHSSAPAANPTWFSSLKVESPPWAEQGAAAEGGVAKLMTVAIGTPDPAAEAEVGRAPFSSRPPPMAASTQPEAGAPAADGGVVNAADADWDGEPITGVAVGKAAEIAPAFEDELSSHARDAAASAVRAAFDATAVGVVSVADEAPTSPRVADAATLSALAAADEEAFSEEAMSALTPHEGARVISGARTSQRVSVEEVAGPALAAFELADRATLPELAGHEHDRPRSEPSTPSSARALDSDPEERDGAAARSTSEPPVSEATLHAELERSSTRGVDGEDASLDARQPLELEQSSTRGVGGDRASVDAPERRDLDRSSSGLADRDDAMMDAPEPLELVRPPHSDDAASAEVARGPSEATRALEQAAAEHVDASSLLLAALLPDPPNDAAGARSVSALDITAEPPVGYGDVARKRAEVAALPDAEARARTLISAVLSGRSAPGEEPVTRPLTAAEIELARASKWGELTAPFADLTVISSSRPPAEPAAEAEAVASFDLRTFDPHRTVSEFSLAASSFADVAHTESAPAQPSAAQPSEPAPAPSQIYAPRTLAKRSKLRDHVQLVFTLAALAAVGYVGQRYLTLQGGFAGAWNAVTHAVSPPMAATRTALETSLRSGTDPNLVAGKSLPYIDRDRGVAVAAGQGLLVIEYTGAEPAPHVAVDGQDVGAAPIAVALPAARHELSVQQNHDAVVRSLIVTAGETRIVTLPLSTH